MSELQRGPDISVMYEVWQRIEWANGTIEDWRRSLNAQYSTIEAAREKIATLPVVIPYSTVGAKFMIAYRIRRSITVLDWLE